ncbi:MAG: hypothetical protein P4L57_07690 [Rhizomicrobium sp.]|nr:hypothetical protein [Rhizomicrobium sp.]
MQCVVPLAGPQLSHPQHGLMACYPVDGVPLLKRTLETRAWWSAGRLTAADLVFVLREGEERAELRSIVTSWFPGCRFVTLPGLTKGALLSALAGAATITKLDEPLIIDLADILYDAEMDIEAQFGADPSLGALVPYFEADDPCYSYFRLDAEGFMAFAAEKQVISHHASAGTYIFRSTAHFIAAAGQSLTQARSELTVGSALFVCPVLNSVVRQGARVKPIAARNIRSISKLFHDAPAQPHAAK